MSKNNPIPNKASKVLGLSQKAAKTLGVGSGAKALSKAVSSGKAAPKAPATKPGFKGAQVTSQQRMKPTTPIIGANRGQGANFATVNKERMKGTIKKTGIGF